MIICETKTFEEAIYTNSYFDEFYSHKLVLFPFITWFSYSYLVALSQSVFEL